VRQVDKFDDSRGGERPATTHLRGLSEDQMAAFADPASKGGMTMDARTAEALEKSIKHWENNAEAERPKDASTRGADCALCGLFYIEGCEGCPVYHRTGGEEECSDTPYYQALYCFKRWERYPDDQTSRDYFRAAASEEVKFLKSLRKEIVK
jgi:hypothetical protein